MSLLSIPNAEYRAAAGVSNSSLKEIAHPLTPAHYHAKHIAKLIKEETSDALTIGTATHRCILEPDTAEGAFHVRPADLSFATKEGKAWKAEHGDAPILTAEQAADIAGMKESVWRHEKAASILRSSDCERSAFADFDGMMLKSRFDALPRKGNVIADLKTIERADLESVEKAMLKYGYFRQAAFYLKVANLIGLKRDFFVFIFVEKTPPYAVACYTPTDIVLEAGRMLIERDLMLLRQCMESDSWPGYSAAIEPCALPAWAMKQLEQVA